MLRIEDSQIQKELKQIIEYQDNVGGSDAEKEKTQKRSRSADRGNFYSIVNEVRCPLCRFVLVARQSRDGPTFFCACRPYEKYGKKQLRKKK